MMTQQTAKWKPLKDDSHGRCSACGCIPQYGMKPRFLELHYNFCPKCGAKMINPRGARCDRSSRECRYKNKYGMNGMNSSNCEHRRDNNCALLIDDGTNEA